MGKAPDFLFLKYKNQIRKRFGLKTKKNRIIKKYFDRFYLELVQVSIDEDTSTIHVNFVAGDFTPPFP